MGLDSLLAKLTADLQVEGIDLRITTLTTADSQRVIVLNTIVLSQIVLKQDVKMPEA
jgi:dihydroorotate dehydrogenase